MSGVADPEDVIVEEMTTVKSLTAKEIKKIARPEFAANPDKFYPTKTLQRLGFSRHSCPTCKNNYWRHSDKKTTCGDSLCEKKYTFIGAPRGIGKEKKLSYGDAWKSFEKSLTEAAVPCTSIPRYPVVARWRADVDYVAAGIFCFQPYCVTGELDPPANPLICPQFCLRFNDLDNIGLTGRHYSGFVMMGIQVFNTADDTKFWADECIEFNYNWLVNGLKIDPDEITFVEDVWAGGGNLGPCIEYFIGGLEVGNMVFMQYKTFPDGSREELDVKVIDVGIGLERIPWLVNGTATSYVDVFPSTMSFMLEKTGVELGQSIWDSYGPLSCLLNIDEVEDLSETWKYIADQIGQDVEVVRKAIEPVRDIYIVCDHTRSVLMAIEDGSLPSNVGGASNVRNILRRVFGTLTQKGWWDDIGGMEGLLHLFALHKKDLARVYGEFKEYKSFNAIIELEYERWKSTDEAAAGKLSKLMKKRKDGLGLEDWFTAVTSWGLPVDVIERVTKQPCPGNLFYTIAERQEQMVKVQPTVLYSTAHLTPTDCLYYADHLTYKFDAKIVAVFPNVTTKNLAPNIVVLDRSHFYPTSGGQEHDTGKLTLGDVTYDVVNVTKVGPCVLHEVSPALPTPESDAGLEEYVGQAVSGVVDEERRSQLRNNHTATHIMYASCRKILGPHVWQNGAKKTVKQAHLDITHYKSLTTQQVMDIENEAARIVRRAKQINKSFMDKSVAEKEYGFHLYQGGVVPGNELRVVSIDDTDTEACCGTHADNTAEIGLIKVLRTNRISDGIVRLYYVAGEAALARANEEKNILTTMQQSWSVTLDEMVSTGDRFFQGYKKLSSQCTKQQERIMALTTRTLLLDEAETLWVVASDAGSPTMCIGGLPPFARDLADKKKGIVYVGESWLYGLLGDGTAYDTAPLLKWLVEHFDAEVAKNEAAGTVDKKLKKPALRTNTKVTVKPKDKKAKKYVVDGIAEFTCFSLPSNTQLQVIELLVAAGFKRGDL